MSFGEAFEAVQGRTFGTVVAMRLPHWGEDVKVSAQIPDGHSKMTAPYLYVSSRFGNVPWMPTQIELFSREWIVTT